MKKVTLYTDGACSGNPGPGGFCAILVYQGHEKCISGGEKETTNNRMELMAVIRGLAALKESCEVEIVSDSKYVVDAMKHGWAKKWQKNNWMRNKSDRAKNPELWEKLLSLCDTHHVTFSWVKGHADNPMNNRCDEMAVQKSKEYSTKV